MELISHKAVYLLHFYLFPSVSLVFIKHETNSEITANFRLELGASTFRSH